MTISGGAAALGGSLSTAGGSGGSQIGTLGQPCATGAYACAGHAQRQQIACVNGVWAPNGTCPVGQYCDSRAGADVGACAPIVAACVDAVGNTFCDALSRVACGPDLVSTHKLEECVSQACVAGECTGVCTPGAKKCSGNAAQTCDDNGAWAPPIACVNQACTGDGLCSGVCTPGTKKCSDGSSAQTCDSTGASWGTATACPDSAPACTGAGECGSPPSCSGLAASCGVSGSENCCTTVTIPGGTFNRSNNAVYPATVSDFRLDYYEVTVGRFRKFWVASGFSMIPTGAGKNVNNASDAGWDNAWNVYLQGSTSTMTSALKCDTTFQTWTDAVGANEDRPMNCVNWYEAQAFCTWDGGRLPTEAEWNYAAAGGNEQRVYPWGATAPAADASLAVYGCYYNGTNSCEALDIAPVGSVLAGNGKWGQADLAGNIWEWTQDQYSEQYQANCNNCANLTSVGNRTVRGGAYDYDAAFLTSTERIALSGSPESRFNNIGMRCARNR
ncbi:MAG: formylglycine-generating enzyme family protein [Polyangiaceae bacterium]|nr:formylglycine-generating enzyme family protein [Polyangiaceae bacterium]